MTEIAPVRSPAERVQDVEKMIAEMRAAVQEALARHKRLGNSIAVWRDGRVVVLPPDEIPDEIPDPVREG
jgi:hypothetical protein